MIRNIFFLVIKNKIDPMMKLNIIVVVEDSIFTIVVKGVLGG
jgi:hypothetical protein